MTPTRRHYEVRILAEAARAYRRLHGATRERIRSAIDGLSDEPLSPEVTKLVGQDDFRIRVGDYRIVYAVDHPNRVVIVARITHRREVYRRF